jgi:hypothetical protein
VNFLRTVLNYASAAWGLVWGTVTDPAKALQAVWHFIGSVQSLVDHLFSTVSRALLSEMTEYLQLVDGALIAYLRMANRVWRWIWSRQIVPVRNNLYRIIQLERIWRLAADRRLTALIHYDFIASMQYAYFWVQQERVWRLADVAAARAYSVQLVKSALATVQREAADGYNSQTTQRESVIEKIADDLAVRNPALKAAIADLIGLALDVAEVDDPVIRIALSKALQEVIDKLGVDKVMGDLLSTLIAGLTGAAAPTTLQGVTADIAARLTTLEDQWATFMENGGPEVEQAGNEWKSYASIAGDLALVAFFADAVVDPAGWATAVNDTVGAVVSDTFTVIADLIKGV